MNKWTDSCQINCSHIQSHHHIITQVKDSKSSRSQIRAQISSHVWLNFHHQTLMAEFKDLINILKSCQVFDGGFRLLFLYKTGHWRTSRAQRPQEQLSETFWGYSSLIMDGSRVSDFSIERILSPELGHKPPVMEFSPDGYLQGLPGGFSLDYGNLRPPAPVAVPVPMPGCLQYRGMSFGEAYYPYGAGFHHTDFTNIYSNSGVYVHFSNQDSAGIFTPSEINLKVCWPKLWFQFRFKKKLHQFNCKLFGTFLIWFRMKS